MAGQKTIIDYIPPFLDYCEIEKGLADNTQRNYKQYLSVFAGWLRMRGSGHLQPHQLTAKLVWDYRLYLARKYKTRAGGCLGKRSQNYYLTAVRVLLAYFADRDLASLPSSKVKLAKQKTEQSISFLEGSDIERLLKAPNISGIEGLRDRAIMETLFSSGMRISELVALNADDMRFVTAKRESQKTSELSIIGKGKRARTVFISPRAAAWLREYLEARGPDDHKALFINSRTRNPESRRLSPRYIQLMIAKYARAAGLSRKITPHTLRHSYATDLLAHGADLRSVQELLGHRNVATTQIYTHVTNKRLREIHEQFHGRKEAA